MRSAAVSLPIFCLAACSTTPVTTAADAGSDAAPQDAAAVDASCAAAPAATGAGDTCAGFGVGESCDPTCGVPKYGYACTGGGPPELAGCKRVRESALLGDTYCCPDLACVRVSSQDSACKSAALPKLYQCATMTGDGGLLATPAAGCTGVTGLPALLPELSRSTSLPGAA